MNGEMMEPRLMLQRFRLEGHMEVTGSPANAGPTSWVNVRVARSAQQAEEFYNHILWTQGHPPPPHG